ncbi:hypothetical protein MKK88_01050 [Methylobacterium sp. E-005]|uniref:hypothetical protein n=1 Tax=Methylobacterium sp. E-005 TaxID=2836549 RepID=UPI001FB9A44D|nr:hypothetical protein [Methylobacterium sp. E-005]MCJ2084583.1 hypothetical protein [Methylobacterium sp. E-005]
MLDVSNGISHEAASVAVPMNHCDDERGLGGIYTVTARAPDGSLIHEETFHNLITTQGKNAMLDKFLGLGTAYANVLFGLITAGTPVAGDTYASHAFTEAGTSIIAARLAPTYGAASAGTKATSAGTTFTVTNAAGATITGLCQVLGPTGVATPADTATSGAVLFSAGLFSSSITVPQNSTITVSYSYSP